MVLFVFLQIIIIVIDWYLYLAKKFVVVDQIEMEEEDEDQDNDAWRTTSLSDYNKRTSTIDLTSTKASWQLWKSGW